MKQLLLAGILFLLNILTYGQKNSCDWTLSGSVVDQHTGKPMPFATIQLGSNYTTADDEGHYIFQNLCSGEYLIQCSFIGYETIEEKLIINQNMAYDLKLHGIACELNEITIITDADHHAGIQAKNTIEEEDLLHTKGSNLGESMKEISGVNSINTGSSISKPMIHGMHSNRIVILNQGVVQESQQWGMEHAPEIDAGAADELSVIKGADGIRYGSGAIGGTVMVNQKSIIDKPIGGQINLTGGSNGRMGRASLRLEGKPFAKLPLQWRVQGSMKRQGNIKTADYYLRNTGNKEMNYSYQLSWNDQKWGSEVFVSQFNTTLGIFSGAHIGNLTDLMNAIDRGEPFDIDKGDFSYQIERPYQQISHDLFKYKGYWNINDQNKLDWQYSRQYNIRQEFDNHSDGDVPELQFEITTHQADLALESKWAPYHKSLTGLNMMYQKNTYEGRFFIPNFERQGRAVYHIQQLFWEKWEIEGGIRWDMQNFDAYVIENDTIAKKPYQFQNLSSTLAAKYRVHQHVELSLQGSTAWRPPTANELFSDGVHHGAASYERGNEQMNGEQSYQSQFTIAYDNQKKQKFEVSAYYNYIKDFIYLQPTGDLLLTIRGAFPYYEYLQKDAVFRGIDINYFYTLLPHLTYNLKAGIVRAQTTKGDYISFIPPDQYTHGLRYHLKKWWKLEHVYVGAEMQQVMRQNRFDENIVGFPPSPPNAYILFHAKAGFEIDAWDRNVAFAFGVNNLTNVAYKNYMNRFRVFAHEMGRNFTINLQIPLHKEQHENE